MKKIIPFIFLCLSLATYAQKGYRYSVVPGTDNTYLMTTKENKAITYAATVALGPTQEQTNYDFNQLTGAMTITAGITKAYTGDRMTCLFHANGSNRIVTFSTGFSANGTLTVVASTYASVTFTFNGVAWYENTRQNLNGAATTLLAGAGSAAVPSISFSAQNDLGFYKISSSQLGFTEGGALVGGINSNGLFTGAITEQVTGSGITFSKATIQQRTATTYTATGSYTVSATELAGGLLVAATSTATSTMQLPTATAMGTQIGAAAGTTFEFVLLNSGASNGTVTISVNTGIVASDFPGSNTLTRTGSATVGIAVFRLTFISATAATLTRVS